MICIRPDKVKARLNFLSSHQEYSALLLVPKYDQSGNYTHSYVGSYVERIRRTNLWAENECEFLALVSVLDSETDGERHAEEGEEYCPDEHHGQGHSERAPLLPVVLDKVVNDRVKGALRQAPQRFGEMSWMLNDLILRWLLFGILFTITFLFNRLGWNTASYYTTFLKRKFKKNLKIVSQVSTVDDLLKLFLVSDWREDDKRFWISSHWNWMSWEWVRVIPKS